MILPSTNLANLLLLVLTLVCWGSWANMQKLLAKRKWRFELFYLDFALGASVGLVVAAFTLGTFNTQELTFQDNLLITGFRKMGQGVGAGAIFNIGNMLLVAAISIAGMSVAFPIAFALAAAIGVVFAYVAAPALNPVLMFGGAILFVVVALICSYFYVTAADASLAKEQKAIRPDPRAKGAPPPKASGIRPVVLALLGGLFMGLAKPLADAARLGENGLAPYSLGAMFGGGLLLSTLVAAPFFINFPAAGAPVQARTYFKGSAMQHIFGAFSGIVWCVGALGVWLSLSAPASVQVGPGMTYALAEAAAVLAAVWGIVIWKDLANLGSAKTFIASSLVLFLIGIGMVSAAYAK